MGTDKRFTQALGALRKVQSKQKNVQKVSAAKKATAPEHRLYLDLSKVTVKSDTPKNATINHNNWKVCVCKGTYKKWSDFTQTKSDMVERTCEHLHKLKTSNIVVR